MLCPLLHPLSLADPLAAVREAFNVNMVPATNYPETEEEAAAGELLVLSAPSEKVLIIKVDQMKDAVLTTNALLRSLVEAQAQGNSLVQDLLSSLATKKV